MSFLVTRPASPEPGIALRSRLCSAAIFRTSGVDRRRSRSSALSPPLRRGSRQRRDSGPERRAVAGRDGRERARACRTARSAARRSGRRGRARGAGPGGRRGRRGRCRGRGRRRSRHGARLGLDLRHDGLHRDRLALGHQDLRQHARRGRGNLGVHLVGADLEDRLVALDRVAHLLHPPREGALGDGLAHLRHDHINLGHGRSPV